MFSVFETMIILCPSCKSAERPTDAVGRLFASTLTKARFESVSIAFNVAGNTYHHQKQFLTVVWLIESKDFVLVLQLIHLM